MFEIYGPTHAGKLLSMFGRLFSAYLQMVGFSCRMDDLTLTPKGNLTRRKLIDDAKNLGYNVALEYVTKLKDEGGPTLTEQELKFELEKVLRNPEKMGGLDSAMKSKTNPITSNIISSCIPETLSKPFPSNNMQVMTVSGAKGSPVNVSQISCLLGQQELEGKRVPTM